MQCVNDKCPSLTTRVNESLQEALSHCEDGNRNGRNLSGRYPAGVDIGGPKAVIALMSIHRGAIITNTPTASAGGNITTAPPKPRINLSDAVDDLAPAPPPCFINKQHWIGYLKSAAAAQNQRDEPKIIIFVQGEPAINTSFDFCADCDTRTRDAMATAQRCKPDWMQP